MKKIFGYLLLATVLCSGLIVLSKDRKNDSNNQAFPIKEKEDAQMDAIESGAYEFKRLRNPTTGRIPANIRSKELAFAKLLPKKEDGSRGINWMSRGPNNFGGRTRAVAVDVNNENIILTASVTGGIYRSTNGGNSFAQTLTPAQLKSATCLAQDTRATHTNTWYCGTGEFYGVNSIASFSNLGSGNGIYKSTNNGVSWTLIPSTVSNTPATHLTYRDFDIVWDIICDKTNTSQDVVLAAVYGGIYRSADGGSTWAAVLGLDTIGGASEYIDLKQSNAGVFYATLSSTGSDKGIWRSIDGINWINITPTGFPGTYDRMELAIAPSDESSVYLIANTPGSGSNSHQLWHYQYLSGDGSGAGGAWQNRTTHLPDEDCTGFFTFNFGYYSSQSGYDMCISIKPDDANFVLLGGTNVYRSTDGFTSDNYKWIGGYQCDTLKPSNYVWPNHHPDQHQFLFKDSDVNFIYCANDGGLFKSQNITAANPIWTNISNGYLSTQFYTVAIEPGLTSSDIIVGGLQDNGTWYTSTDNPSDAWKQVFYGDGAFCAITRNHSNYYLSYQSGKTFKFDIQDNGAINGLTRIDPTGGSGYDFINPFILDPSNDNTMYLCAGKYIWRNDSLNYIPIVNDEYNTIKLGWKKLLNTSTGLGISSPSLSSVAMSESNNQKLYFGTDGGQVYSLDTALSNTCPKQLISSGVMPTGAYVSAISADPTNADNVMVSFSNYGVKSIFHSSNAGALWQDVSGNLEQNSDGSGDGPSVNWIHIYRDADTVIYFAGTSVGLFSTSLLNGTSTIWTQEGASSIGNVSVNMITSRAYDGTIVAATHGNGVYSMQLKNVVGIDDLADNSITSASLYPNPMANQTVIEMHLNTAKMVRVEIYNMYGQKIRTIINNELLIAGKHRFQWDGLQESKTVTNAGQYYVVITADQDRQKVLKLMKYNE